MWTAPVWHICDVVFVNSIDLARHVGNTHPQVPVFSHNLPPLMLPDSVPDFIPQIDGNFSLLSDTSDSIADEDPTIVSTATTSSPHLQPQSSLQNLAFNYQLNEQNQVKRLIENAAKSPFSITYKDTRNLNGQELPTSAFIECNAGVYATAVKPALDAICEGWICDISDTNIKCVKVSNRFDKSGHLVSTQITLNLQPKDLQARAASKPVVHFYHTSSSILVQGSKLMPEGISSATWVVQFFLEPLATLHISENMEVIESVNSNILHNVETTSNGGGNCGKCSNKVPQKTTSVRDQPIKCDKCGYTFHKKCTDRQRLKSNWRKKPWFCQQCVLTYPIYEDGGSLPFPGNIPTLLGAAASSSPTITVDVSFETLNSSRLNATAMDFIPQLQPQTVPSLPQPDQVPRPDQPTPAPSQDLATPSPPQGQSSVPPQGQQTHAPAQILTIPRFPNYSTRQRSSNINVDNPDIEFLKTAVSSCRSTISQQQTELNRLEECVKVRDKRIMNLEAQVGVAADTIASRNPANDITDVKMNALLSKLDKISSPANNIYISSCNHHQPTHSQGAKSTVSTTTYSCTTCDKIFFCCADLNTHLESSHAHGSFSCQFCETSFKTEHELNHHIELTHENASHPCQHCGDTFESDDDMNDHIEKNHSTDGSDTSETL